MASSEIRRRAPSAGVALRGAQHRARARRRRTDRGHRGRHRRVRSGRGNKVSAATTKATKTVPDAKIELYATPRGMSDAEILQMWDENRIDAANRGTWIHWQLELWSNSLPCHVDAELLHGLRFVGDVLRPMGIKAWATEKEIFSEAEEVCGSVDWIGMDESDPDTIVIVDWKRSKKLDAELVSGYNKTMSSPLHHLHDCHGAVYTLQLSVYAEILRRCYGKRIRALALCCVHDEHAMCALCAVLQGSGVPAVEAQAEIAARTRVDVDDAMDEQKLPPVLAHGTTPLRRSVVRRRAWRTAPLQSEGCDGALSRGHTRER